LSHGGDGWPGIARRKRYGVFSFLNAVNPYVSVVSGHPVGNGELLHLKNRRKHLILGRNVGTRRGGIVVVPFDKTIAVGRRYGRDRGAAFSGCHRVRPCQFSVIADGNPPGGVVVDFVGQGVLDDGGGSVLPLKFVVAEEVDVVDGDGSGSGVFIGELQLR